MSENARVWLMDMKNIKKSTKFWSKFRKKMKNGLFWSVRGRLELISCRNTYFFTRISILIAPEALDSLKRSFLMFFIFHIFLNFGPKRASLGA